MNIKITDYLDKVREEQGETAWKAEIRKLAKQALQIGGPQHEAFWRELTKDYDWINIDELKKDVKDRPEPQGPDMNQLMAVALQREMPSLKSQEQFNTFRASFDAFKAVLNAIFEGDGAKELEARKILDLAFTAAQQATSLTRKLQDVPEAATSKASDGFKQAPLEYGEYDLQRELLAELTALPDDAQRINAWYTETKDRRDKIRSQTLRDVLIDAIRSRVLALQTSAAPS